MYSCRTLTARLAEAGIVDADCDALLLLERYADVSRARLIAEPERMYGTSALADAVEKRLRRVPLQYIFGCWEFMGLSFTVNEHCLIPRSDTERIAEAAIARKPARILDLCTGSGCILASVLYYCPGAVGTAVELLPDTLAVAEKNFLALGLHDRVTTVRGDVRGDVLPAEDMYDVITANPPYIAVSEMAGLAPELSAEPRVALTDEGDGLSLYDAIFQNYTAHLTADGVMLVEHGAAQSEAVHAIAGKYGLSGDTIRDYGGNIRGARLYKTAAGK